jgi:hypothetical protein
MGIARAELRPECPSRKFFAWQEAQGLGLARVRVGPLRIIVELRKLFLVNWCADVSEETDSVAASWYAAQHHSQRRGFIS